MERPGALAPGQIDRRAGRPRHELERSESEWSARAPWRPDKSTGAPVARDMSLSAAKANGAPGRPGARTNQQAWRAPAPGSYAPPKRIGRAAGPRSPTPTPGR